MKTQNVVCPICKSNDIEWTAENRNIDNWYCHYCGHYFHAPMMINAYEPEPKHHKQYAR